MKLTECPTRKVLFGTSPGKKPSEFTTRPDGQLYKTPEYKRRAQKKYENKKRRKQLILEWL